jgi:hypothetical protein
MALRTSTLRPGFLVDLSTTLKGNVRYRAETIEEDHITADGERQASWTTTRTVADPAEHAEAVKVRGKARSIITSVCTNGARWLLCPETKADQLEAAIAYARDEVAKFNSRATITRIDVSIIIGKVASDDVEAFRAINGEIRSLLATMAQGLKNLDVEVVREAANKARALGQMLTVDASERIQVAVDEARKAARAIVQAGEEGVVAVDKAVIARIQEARTAFLDLDTASEVLVAPEAETRAVELSEDYAEKVVAEDAEVAGDIDGLKVPAIKVAELELDDWSDAGFGRDGGWKQLGK